MGVTGIAVDPDRGDVGAVAGERDLRMRGTSLVGLLGENGRQNGSFKNISATSAVAGRTRTEELLDVEMGKHDYDWLLTPPGTPIFPSSDIGEKQLTLKATKNRPTVRSVSSARASRLSATQAGNGHSTRPTRSSSVNRPSISATHSNSISNNRTSSHTTSSASVTSRPSTPGNPSSSSARAPAVSRPLQARSVNPAKTRPALASAAPTGTDVNSSAGRSTSRPSTPTRRPNAAITAGRSPSAGRVPASRNSGASARPSSPIPRNRTLTTSIDLTLFTNEAPPNLRTKLPEKPASAGRTRPGLAVTVRGSSNSDSPACAGLGRKNPVPYVARSKLPDNSAKLQVNRSDQDAVLVEIQKSMASEPSGVRRASKAGLTEGSGFGRTISKMSLDVALKHMDIRQSMGGLRANMLFPHSIRPAIVSKSSAPRRGEAIVPVTNDDKLVSEPGRLNLTASENVPIAAKSMSKDSIITKGSYVDPYGSFRYDAMLLKEDLKNTNWLHSFDDKLDQSPVFDHRFEPPPEPFSPL